MITIVFAKPKVGKTLYMSCIANELAFERERNKRMRLEILNKNANGFNLTIPKHCISANYDLKMRKFGHTIRKNRKINPFRLGFANEHVDVHYSFEYEAIFITEAQKYFNSRMSAYYPDWQSRYFEQHGHNSMDIFMDTQRPMLIDVNIREISSFVEVLGYKPYYDQLGQVYRVDIKLRKIENSTLFDIYMNSGKTNKNCYTECVETFYCNAYKIYDYKSCKPKFLDGHIGSDIDITEGQEIGQTIEDYIKYLEELDDELPVGFYKRRSAI